MPELAPVISTRFLARSRIVTGFVFCSEALLGTEHLPERLSGLQLWHAMTIRAAGQVGRRGYNEVPPAVRAHRAEGHLVGDRRAFFGKCCIQRFAALAYAAIGGVAPVA